MESADDGGARGQGPVASLRGAPVAAFNARRLGRALAVASAATLAALTGVFTYAGIHKNDQIDEIRAHGVPVVMTVTRCLAQMGGSGSQAAGYVCTATYTLGGRTYTATVPGGAERSRGERVPAVADPADAGLVVSPRAAATERTSFSPFVVPIVLGACLVALLAGMVAARRRSA